MPDPEPDNREIPSTLEMLVNVTFMALGKLSKVKLLMRALAELEARQSANKK